MNDIDGEVDKLWARINLMQARTEALETALQATLPLVQDVSAFSAALRKLLNERMANLLCRGVDEKFTTEYAATLRSLLPPHVVDIVKTS
ncbi:MAG: hypothetical protein EPN65_22365 [Pandoraea sp.]|uniref:hypothetical protein n=1 Tax=Pandoraea sp. TaxID=1883445 RepID=UPI0011F85001|nr:hypothetical protein [Pandoraea sp.]TAM13417.1 MAG: hypothetical protein EPN65_22365 [Pandoraea sp.]TAM54265.1 MAG: hypothetical protein EPN57_06490 [Paraburkholderia sp.]